MKLHQDAVEPLVLVSRINSLLAQALCRGGVPREKNTAVLSPKKNILMMPGEKVMSTFENNTWR